MCVYVQCYYYILEWSAFAAWLQSARFIWQAFSICVTQYFIVYLNTTWEVVKIVPENNFLVFSRVPSCHWVFLWSFSPRCISLCQVLFGLEFPIPCPLLILIFLFWMFLALYVPTFSNLASNIQLYCACKLFGQSPELVGYSDSEDENFGTHVSTIRMHLSTF